MNTRGIMPSNTVKRLLCIWNEHVLYFVITSDVPKWMAESKFRPKVQEYVATTCCSIVTTPLNTSSIHLRPVENPVAERYFPGNKCAALLYLLYLWLDITRSNFQESLGRTATFINLGSSPRFSSYSCLHVATNSRTSELRHRKTSAIP